MVLHASCVDTYVVRAFAAFIFFWFLIEDEVGVPRTCDRVGACMLARLGTSVQVLLIDDGRRVFACGTKKWYDYERERARYRKSRTKETR
jgi:hypothetical protein